MQAIAPSKDNLNVESFTDERLNIDQSRVQRRYAEFIRRVWCETDRIFAGLMVFQLIGGIVLAIVYSPRTWLGETSSIHFHVWGAIGLGTLLSSLPIALTIYCPGQAITRHTIAVSQMLWSALLIHICGGRIETHFHVFGSLAFLAFYRDWKILVTATITITADHFFRGVYWPQSVFGVVLESPYQWVEHVAWVAFEDVILILACRRGTRELAEICVRQVQLEQTNETIEEMIHTRTMELVNANERLSSEIRDRIVAEARERQLGRIVEQSVNEAYVFDQESLCCLEANLSALANLGLSRQEILQMFAMDLIPQMTRSELVKLLEPLRSQHVNSQLLETKFKRKDGSTYPVEVYIQLSEWDQNDAYVAIALDITARRKLESDRDAIQKRLLETSRLVGMAEIATGVLHNVGNVLNSVNVSATLIQDRVHKSRSTNLSRIADLLHQHECDMGTFLSSDKKGQMIPKYIQDLSQALLNERQTVLGELTSLTSNINHIKDIVKTQQSFAKVAGQVETLQLSTLVEDAINVEKIALERHDIEIVCDFSETPSIATQKHKVLQILINLIANAKNAISESDSPEKRITIRTFRIDEEHTAIECIDTGSGISPENFDRIFRHGFTTREAGHGFGLHSSANAAMELGGTLRVRSDGIGTGATFRLTLPIVSPTHCDRSKELPSLAMNSVLKRRRQSDSTVLQQTSLTGSR